MLARDSKKKNKKELIQENTAPLSAVGEPTEGAATHAQVAEEERTELDQLRVQLAEAQAQAAEYLDGWQRAQAEFANFRKRKESEWSQMILRANAGLLVKLLPVVDDFERAIATVPEELKDASWIEGVMLVQRKLDGILESEGVQAFECQGHSFDPRYHDAVAYEEAEGYEDGQIVEDLRHGYMFGERVLRPALVRVAKVPSAVPNDTITTTEDKE